MSHTVRPATLADIPALVGMGKRFFDASAYEDVTAFDQSSFATTLAQVIPSGDAVMLVVEKAGQIVGMAAAVIYGFYFNLQHRTAQELFWWVDKAHRGIGSELFNALVHHVKERGAESLSMIALESLEPERVGTFYRRNGFRPSEHSYIGKL